MVKPMRRVAGQLQWAVGACASCASQTIRRSIRKEVESYLRQDLPTSPAATLCYCQVLAIGPESRLAAIVDFMFNSRCCSAAGIHAASAP